jgi:hypothetical protein
VPVSGVSIKKYPRLAHRSRVPDPVRQRSGQYRNVGIVVATTSGNRYTDSDASYYFEESTEDSKKVEICHRTDNGSFHLIDISVNAEPISRAHGDARPREPIPGNAGLAFTASCDVK